MEDKRKYRVIKNTFLIILIISTIFVPSCGTQEGTTSKEKENLQTEEQDLPKEEEPQSIGLTSFRTQDINGEEVNQDIFQNYSLTLVNVWGTFCGSCLDEMPVLGELQKKYVSKGVNIVGIVVDVQDEDMGIIEDQRKLAQEIVSGTGANYTHLLISEDMIEPVLSQFDAIPASFFVDNHGNIVSEFYIGSREKEDWVTIIEETIKNQE